MTKLFQYVQAEDSYDQLRLRLVGEAQLGTTPFTLFRAIIPKATQALVQNIGAVAEFATNLAPTKGFFSSDRDILLKALRNLDFVAYEDTLITVPEGFQGKLIPFLEVLIGQADIVGKESARLLSTYETELSVFLSNESARTAIRSHSEVYKKIRAQREAYQKATQAFFKAKNPTQTRRRLNEVIDRTADLEKITQLEQKLRRLRDGFDYRSIQTQTTRCVDMLKLISERINRGDIDDVSPEVAKSLSEGAYEVGRYVEYVAIYAYHTESALACIRNICQILTELLSPKAA